MSVETTISSRIKAYSNFRVGYGLLYNWYVISDARGIAPTGWHIATQDDMSTLSTYLGGNSVSAGPLKETGFSHWDSPNTGATNTSGFTALANGVRSSAVYLGTTFVDMAMSCTIWSSTEYDSTRAYPLHLYYNTTTTNYTGAPVKTQGRALRCVRDTKDGWLAGEKVVDINGNVYDTVEIGTQVWLKQNLKTTKYNNGDTIPEVTEDNDWINLSTGALCAYENNWGYV